MSDLYLRSVEFSNFRIYGDSYAFELPDGPGVTLITGANGLGKTSFFDGVEWALTNQVSRFQDIPLDGRRKEQDPLTRIGAPENSHRVSLQFSDGDPIDRGGGFVPDEGAIAALLKRAEWTDIANLHGYLSITHFLGQASAQRFSLRKPDKQWEALKGPAGVDRINLLRERMSGLGVRRAFTRAIEDRTKRLEEASNALATWDTRIAELARARTLSSSDAAVAPEELRRAVTSVGNQILETIPNLRWSAPPPTTPSENLLESLADMFKAVEHLTIRDSEAADALEKIATQYESANAETATLRTVAADIEQRRAAAVENLSQAEASYAKATAHLANSERLAAQHQARAASLSHVQTAVQQLTEAEARSNDLAAQLRQSAAEASEVQTKIAELRTRLSQSTARRSERRALADRVALARRRAELSGKLTVTRDEIERLKSLIANRPLTELRLQREALAARETAAQTLVASITSDLRAHDDRTQAIAQAVSAIAHRLAHDDLNCPVCATEFPPGRLVELVKIREALDPQPSSALAAALAEARVEIEKIRRQLAEIDRAIAEGDQLQASISALHDREQEFRQQLVEAAGSADGSYSDSEADNLNEELALLDSELVAAETPDQITVQIEEAEATFNAETAKSSTLQRVRDATEEQVERARAALRQHSELWNDDAGLLIELDAEQARISASGNELAVRLAADRSAETDAAIGRDRARELLMRETQAQATSNAKLDTLAAERSALIRRWGEIGQSGEPDPARVAQHRARIFERAASLEPLRSTQQYLVTGYRKWLDDEKLRQLESGILATVQQECAPSEGEVRPLLVQRVDEAREQLALAQAARKRIDTVGAQLQQRAESYAEDVLVPLNATIQRFARTLMTWSDASIIYRAEHHVTRSELRPGIIRSSANGSSSTLEMNPNLYFSEGQLSALSVAALLAASTTFAWSRWRGLLLDDPLQHNDVIHASAFMDLVRQMVRELGYQVILSTHDSSEAEFLGRKCRSAGIPYHVHELIPHGEDGLVSQVA